MSVIRNELLLATDEATGYNLTKSLRFRSSASAYLSRTPASASNQKTWTWSGWVKRGTLGAEQCLMSCYVDGNNQARIAFNSSDNIDFYNQNAGSISARFTTTAVFRDPSAWYHIVVSLNAVSGTGGVYVNGVSQTLSTNTNTNANTYFNSTNAQNIGRFGNGSQYFDGYQTEVNWIDGQALTPSSFGENNADTGVWQPKAYTGTYATNGFYLPFTDVATTSGSNAGLGKDFSGNGNYWTTNNISVTAGSTYDSMTDVPTLTSATAANYAVLNPLYEGRSTITNGNLTASGTTDLPTIIPSSGDWYFEIDGTGKQWTPPASFPSAAGNYNFGQRPFTNSIPSGYKALNVFNLPDSPIPAGNTAFNIALDTGSNIKTASESLFTGQFLEWIKDRANSNNHQLLNSVTGLSAVLQSNTTSAETTYSAPSGNSVGWVWKAGASASSNTSGSITSQVSANPTAGFSVVTYTGTGANATVGHGLGVAPKFIIIKNRTAAAQEWQVLHQSANGGSGHLGALFLNLTAAWSSGGYFGSTAPTSTVFSLDGSSYANGNGNGIVAYCWSEIAGFSKFGSYTGNGSADGVFVYTGFRPKFILTKLTSGADQWYILDSSRDTYNVAGLDLAPNQTTAEVNDKPVIDFLSNGYKLRCTYGSYNGSGQSYIYAAFAENPMKYALAR